MERALSFWASGDDRSMKTEDDGRPKLAALFGELEWGPKACGWSQSTSRLTSEQWRMITAEATARSRKFIQSKPTTKTLGRENPHAVLNVWAGEGRRAFGCLFLLSC